MACDWLESKIHSWKLQFKIDIFFSVDKQRKDPFV